MKKFKIISREILINEKFCHIEKQVVEFPNGGKGDWFVDMKGDAVLVVPVTPEGEVVLQKIYKHGCGEIIVEFCAGMVDEGETPENAVQRELMEETGYSAEKFVKVGEIFANPTGAQMKYHIFVALDAKKIGSQELEEAEQIETFTVSSLKKAGDFLTDPQTITCASAITALKFTEKYFDKKT